MYAGVGHEPGLYLATKILLWNADNLSFLNKIAIESVNLLVLGLHVT